MVDADTGVAREAQPFVAALGASSFTYAEATWTQTLPDWIGVHTRAFAFLGGVPAMIVSDNLKSGITRACFHEPAINRAYAEMAAYHDTAVVPARPVKPRVKVIVEGAVQVATLWITAKLRKRIFFSLAEFNAAIREGLDQLSDRTSRHLGATRRPLFEQFVDSGSPRSRREGAARQDRRIDAGERLFRVRARQGGVAERKAMIDRDHAFSVSMQAEIIGIARSTLYYLPCAVPAADLKLMHRIDRLHMELPFAGARMLRRLLAINGGKVGRRHVKTLKSRLGIEALYRRPRTT